MSFLARAAVTQLGFTVRIWQSSWVPSPTRPPLRVLVQFLTLASEPEVESSPVGRGCWSQAHSLTVCAGFDCSHVSQLWPWPLGIPAHFGGRSLPSSILGTWFPPQQSLRSYLCTSQCHVWCPVVPTRELLLAGSLWHWYPLLQNISEPLWD